MKNFEALSRRYLLRPEHHVLLTAITPGESAERLRGKIRGRRDVPMWREDSRILTGWVKGQRFSIYLRGHMFEGRRSSSAPKATGFLSSMDEGTRVEVRIGLSKRQVAQLVVGGIGFIVVGIALIFALVSYAISHQQWLILLLVLVALGLALRSRQRELPQEQEKPFIKRNILLDILSETLEAHSID